MQKDKNVYWIDFKEVKFQARFYELLEKGYKGKEAKLQVEKEFEGV